MQEAHATANRGTRNLIDPSSLDIAPSEYSDFKSLCLNIYDFVANNNQANLFKLKSNFPEDKFTMFNEALKALISDSSISNGFYGFVAGPRPTFIGPNAVRKSTASIKRNAQNASNTSRQSILKPMAFFPARNSTALHMWWRRPSRP
ncbi:hypothetical protein [Candidatus Methanomethylophilus sp. 1R26]|uniref:hypothetical protein n=1 Tax=Candidatus Methanomethylophilus sp. 1R26 TaxID=1769296 RepID=UPI0012FF369E|nr:hypothetical protein [Candidatus Methanomethylophilus sp. 1R26]